MRETLLEPIPDRRGVRETLLEPIPDRRGVRETLLEPIPDRRGVHGTSFVTTAAVGNEKKGSFGTSVCR